MVDTFLNHKNFQFSILRIETTREAQQIKIPPFVKVLREVTEEEIYETRLISDQKYVMPEKDKREIEEKLKNFRSLQLQQQLEGAIGGNPSGGGSAPS